MLLDKMKNKQKYHSVGTFPNSKTPIEEIVEKGKFDTPETQILYRALFCLVICTSI